ncbi:2-C-methyl-D-erythritol 4-phosphate cytidylyltransferase [Rhodococcus aerolatus]
MVALVPAAGSGTRLGAGVAKAFVEVAGTSLLRRCVDGLHASGVVDEVVVVVPAALVDDATALLGPGAVVVAGGLERSHSVRAGLARALAGPAVPTHVLVHDAARALTPPAVVVRVVEALRAGAQAVVPVLPVVDTVKRVDATGAVVSTVDRTELRAVQTPQGFTREALVAAHADDAHVATDDAGHAERVGVAVVTVAGDPLAFKVTTPLDLLLADAVLAAAVRA